MTNLPVHSSVHTHHTSRHRKKWKVLHDKLPESRVMLFPPILLGVIATLNGTILCCLVFRRYVLLLVRRLYIVHACLDFRVLWYCFAKGEYNRDRHVCPFDLSTRYDSKQLCNVRGLNVRTHSLCPTACDGRLFQTQALTYRL